MIIGTAGHIDHGKSTLIEALTGSRMDRLREERERGITIELNFAPFDLGDGQIAGVIDVPGHEDFVRTMVAGASGIDLVLLVVAADEGIKPQTREHLAIAEQLGIARGIPVLTKVDLVEQEWAGLVELEVSDWLKQSSIVFESPQLVSATTGKGIPELAAGIRRLAAAIPPRAHDDLFRLPVDRAFSVAGIGTVVTGTAWSGTIASGDQAVVLPARSSVRVRTVQVHGRDVARAEPGRRVALGLAGIDREEIRRGDTVVAAGTPWETTVALDVELSLLPDAPRALSTRSRVRLHLGTSELIARVFPRQRIEPGTRGMARIALESPAIARGGDRFVLRGYSPVLTIGGGRVIDPMPPRRQAQWPEGLSATPDLERLRALIERRPGGVRHDLLPLLLGRPASVCEHLVRRLEGYRRIEDHWVNGALVAQLRSAATAALESFHRARPGDPGMPLGELRQSLRAPPWLVNGALGDLHESGVIALTDGIARRAGFTPKVSGGDEQVNRVVGFIQRSGLTPPSVSELADALQIRDLTPTLRLAAKDRRIEAVERDRYYAAESLGQFVTALVELGQKGPITPGAVRDRLGITRKFLIPLLEWADTRGITVRVGEGRKLRPGYQLPSQFPAP